MSGVAAGTGPLEHASDEGESSPLPALYAARLHQCAPQGRTVEQRGVGARAEQADALSMSRILSWEIEGVELICLCYLEAATPAQIRYAIRRIRRRIPDVSIIVASLGRPVSVEDDEVSAAGAESVHDSLSATIDKVMAVALTQSGEKTSVGAPVALVS